MINIQEVPKDQMNSLSKVVLSAVTRFYENPENQRRFEEWHLSKYGVLPTNASYMKCSEN